MSATFRNVHSHKYAKLRRVMKNQAKLQPGHAVLTVKETCAYLRVSEPTLRSWVRDGRVLPCRIGSRRVVFLLRELERFLADSMTRKAA